MITLKYISLIFCSFFIFIYVLTQLRALLLYRCEEKVKYCIKNFTSNYHASFILGIILTIILSSSNAVTILVIAFLGSDIIKEKSALSLLLGSNIGTTLSVFLFSFDIGIISIFILLIGLILKALKRNTLSLFFIYLSLIFYTITIINISFEFLNNNIKLIFSNANIITLLEGCFITALVNSSSTTILSANFLYSNSTISLSQGISLMLGANIGTTISTYFYTINNDKKVKKIIIFNIIFNIFGALFFLVFLDYFILLLDLFLILQFKGQTIVLSHLIFNAFTTIIIYIILIPFKFDTEN